MTKLVPVSLHLRNFNKYIKLDLTASEKGNLTLIGKNAAGKTTLANCFFPLLIDGSIATPSFNPAKGTERLDSSGKPRNSARDTRTFDSMLLGWGNGAMKVRTGYTYMRLASSERQVILGIGAHRVTGEKRKPTWWFVVISEQVDSELTVVTTNEAGDSLSKTEFIDANTALGTQFRVFDNAAAYQEYVAAQVYSFDSATLTKLTAVYRLLASPILTGGDARFTPIREALKNAQAGIDDQVIVKVAASQRELNRMNSLLKRIEVVQGRLAKIKNDVFWSNLNNLNATFLKDYGAAHQDFENQRQGRDEYRRKIDEYVSQIKLITKSLKKLEDKLAVLRQEVANQNSIMSQRKSYTDQINALEKEILTYENVQQQLADKSDQAVKVEQEQAAAQADYEHLISHELRPLQAELSAKVESLTDLRDVLAEVDLKREAQRLRQYVQQYQKVLSAYEANQNAQSNLSRDVKIVGEMRVQMDGRIEDRVQGIATGRFREGLLSDNLDVHNAGAKKMNTHLAPLLAQATQLLTDNADLKQLLSQPELLGWIDQQRHALTKIIKQQTAYQQTQEKLDERLNYLDGDIKTLEASPSASLDVVATKQKVETLTGRRDALKVDQTVKQRLKQVEEEFKTLGDQSQDFKTKQGKLQGRVESAESRMAVDHDKMQQLSQLIEAALQTLSPYFPDELELTNVATLIDFIQQHRSAVKNMPYEELTDKIGKHIRRNDANGVDRNAIDDLFEERGHMAEASALHQNRSVQNNDVKTVAFDINHVQELISDDQRAVSKAVEQLKVGNDVAQVTYLSAAIKIITDQYRLINDYNDMLAANSGSGQSIKLKVTLTPSMVAPIVIEEARDAHLQTRPNLLAEIQRRLDRLANDTSIMDDKEFMVRARELLDTRQWSDFEVWIKRRQSSEDEYEIVDDKFVQSGGSGAEKAQAMVLPLLLVPKMVLQRANLSDAPYWVMFDEFADKLDPETAKLFAKTIARFGFNFIATMPAGAQNKILADQVDNVA